MQELESGEDFQESGWKLLHGDVFRPPKISPLALAVAVGTGTQILIAAFIVLFLLSAKMLNPMKKGQALSSIVLLYVLCGSVAGYVSSRLYKFFGGTSWKQSTLLTAVAFPGVCVVQFLILNVFLSFAGAAASASIWTILAIFLLWICVASPLVFVGSFFGFRASTIEAPTKVNQIARVVPDRGQALRRAIVRLFIGGMSFSTICIEMYFIMNAIWMHEFYYLIGYLACAFALLSSSCALISIIVCYLRLCQEDHEWWWNAFFDCGLSGVWVFLYSAWYVTNRLHLVGVLPIVVYWTYMSMISITFSLFTGSSGFLSTLWFVKTIYGAIKVD